jgi:hypothetical protein
MNDAAKVALAFGGGVLAERYVGKMGWLLAGTAAIFIFNSPEAQSAIHKGASSAAKGISSAYSSYRTSKGFS